MKQKILLFLLVIFMSFSVVADEIYDRQPVSFEENEDIEYNGYREIENLNKELYQISSEKIDVFSKVISVFGVGKAVEKKNRLISKSMERKEVMLKLADKNPDLFLSFTISEKQRSTIFKETSPYFEKEVVREGSLEVMESPHIMNENSLNKKEFEYYLTSGSKRYNLEFADGSSPKAVSGDWIKVNGVELDNYFVTSSAETRAVQFTEGDGINEDSSSIQKKRIENFGNQKIAIIITKSSGEGYDLPFLQNHMQKASSYFDEVSYGQANLTWDVYGPFEVHGSYSSFSDPEIDAYVNFSRYSRIISVDSRNCFGCATVGLSEYETDDGRVNLSITWVTPSVFQVLEYYSVIIHELGHNFGALHSNLLNCGGNYTDNFGNCRSFEYGDYFDVMGSNIYNFATGHINSLYKDIITWIGENNINETILNGIYTIYPLETRPNSSDSTGIITLKVPRTIDEFGNAKDFYYLEYRKSIGYDYFINLTNSSGVQLRLNKFIKNGPGHSPSQHISLREEIYPHYAQINEGESFFDFNTNLNLTTLEVTPQNAKINVELSDKQCIRREPILKISPPSISGILQETFYYNFELTNNDSSICSDREIYFNNTGSYNFIPKRYNYYISNSQNYPSLISPGDNIRGVISIYPNSLISGEIPIELIDVERGKYESFNISFNIINPNFKKVDFDGEDKAERFLYDYRDSRQGYYLVDNLGKVYRRGITHFTTDNGPEFSDGNYLSEIDYNNNGQNIILLDIENNLYDVGALFISQIATPNEPLPENIKSFDVDYNEGFRLVFLGREGRIYLSYIGGFGGYYENTWINCLTWDGKTNLLQLGVNHTTMIKATEDNFYILTKNGEVYVCGKGKDDGMTDASLGHFSQALPADLGTGDKEAVSFAVIERKDIAQKGIAMVDSYGIAMVDSYGIAMVDSYGNVYTSGNIQYQGSPSFGQNIARDIQLFSDGSGYGILKGTGEIYECVLGVCSIKDIEYSCKNDIDCNDNNNYTEDKCILDGANNYCNYQVISCIKDSDCIKDRLQGVCVNPGKVNSYCRYNEPPSVKICFDADGYNSANASFVNYSGNIYNDVCENNNQVKEYYCKLNIYTQQNEVASSIVQCKDNCADGACAQEEQVYRKCADDDALNNVSVKGNVIFENNNYSDKCEENSLSVRQYFCVGDKLRNFVKRCSGEMRCGDGKCG